MVIGRKLLRIYDFKQIAFIVQQQIMREVCKWEYLHTTTLFTYLHNVLYLFLYILYEYI